MTENKMCTKVKKLTAEIVLSAVHEFRKNQDFKNLFVIAVRI